MSIEREAFEQAVTDRWSDSYSFTRFGDEDYYDEVLEGMWRRWQAFRQALSSCSENPNSCEPVTLQPTNAWQFFQDGEWRVGSNLNNHKQNTIDGGYPVRDLYVPQSTESETQGDLQRTDDKQDQAVRVPDGRNTGEAKSQAGERQ